MKNMNPQSEKQENFSHTGTETKTLTLILNGLELADTKIKLVQQIYLKRMVLFEKTDRKP